MKTDRFIKIYILPILILSTLFSVNNDHFTTNEINSFIEKNMKNVSILNPIKELLFIESTMFNKQDISYALSNIDLIYGMYYEKTNNNYFDALINWHETITNAGYINTTNDIRSLTEGIKRKTLDCDIYAIFFLGSGWENKMNYFIINRKFTKYSKHSMISFYSNDTVISFEPKWFRFFPNSSIERQYYTNVFTYSNAFKYIGLWNRAYHYEREDMIEKAVADFIELSKIENDEEYIFFKLTGYYALFLKNPTLADEYSSKMKQIKIDRRKRLFAANKK